MTRDEIVAALREYLDRDAATTYGGESLLDESIHIASAFRLAGVANVIATLWPVHDRSAPGLWAAHVHLGS
jgi:CHAT domain-containing protein